MANDVLDNEVQCFLGGDCSERFSFDPLREVVECHNHVLYSPISHGKGSDKVTAPYNDGPRTCLLCGLIWRSSGDVGVALALV